MRASLLACALLAASAAALAALVEIRWDGGGRFAHRARVAPQQFAEVCGRLDRGERIAWEFRSSAPTDFNIHYHDAGDRVVYPERRDATAAARGVLAVDVPQGYCWMWTNRAPGEAEIELRLEREPR